MRVDDLNALDAIYAAAGDQFEPVEALQISALHLGAQGIDKGNVGGRGHLAWKDLADEDIGQWRRGEVKGKLPQNFG